MFGHKTLRCKYTATSSRKRDELGQELCLRSQFAWTEFSQYLGNLRTFWRPLKQSFYMFRVRRKEGPKTYSWIPSTLLTNSWTFTPIPNLTCFVVIVPFFDARLPSTWLTNCADASTQLQSPTKKVVSYKVFQFIHTMKIKKILGHKTLRCTYTATSSREKDELRQEFRLRSQFA